MQGDSLRVCMVTGYRPTPGGGGTEKHVYELARGLLDRGVEVDVICEDRSFLPDRDTSLAGRIIGLQSDSLRAPNWVPRYKEKSARFAELLHPKRYDIVHCHNHYGFGTALRLARFPDRPALVSTFHLTPLGSLERYEQLGIPEPEGAPIDRAVALMEEATAQLSDACIAVSHGVAREVERHYHVPADRISVIHNWFRPDIFYPRSQADSRRLLGLDPGRQYLLYVGHFGLQRGEMMRSALRLLPPEVTLLVVTDEEDPSVQTEFGNRVRFTGYVRPEEMATYYSAADLQCFPSVYGGFGLVILEGLACGCPAVVFDHSAMNEIVNPQSGYLVAEATPEAYAQAIRGALADRGEKRANAAQRARCFDLDVQIDRVASLYERIASPTRPGVKPVAEAVTPGR